MNCTSLQALVAAYSAANCSDTEPSVPSSGTHTPKLCCWHDSTMEPSRLSRFGMTCKPLTDDHGAALLTLLLEAFRAKTSASQETGLELTESEAECGTTWPASLAKFDRDTCSWKTAQLSLLGDLEEFSETWPQWGLMRNGVCWERQTLALLTNEGVSGSWQSTWPTPNCNGYRSDGELAILARTLESHAEYLGMSHRAASSKRDRYWPTATATAHKGWSPNHHRANTNDRLDYTIEREAFRPGQQTPPMRLNPNWVEWLMGWPIGHTALEPLETDKFQEWRLQHGGYSVDR